MKIYTAENVTAEEIKAVRDRACECRPGLDADERLPIRSGEHAAIHDCDDDTFDLCLVALGANPYHTPRGTTEAIAMQIDARAKIAEILNEHGLPSGK